MDKKSSALSAVFREKGNTSYKCANFSKALLFYNRALAFAENNDDLSLAYANRSAVYLEVKKYDECLQNIEWARENEYPEEKLEKLKEREEKCMKLKADDKKVQESFFKLSYPANKKIPFIVENLYMKETPEYGRGIYAATDLKAGDVIAIEESVFSALKDFYDSQFKHCCYCMKSCMMNLIPCLKTSAVMFCSEDCRNKVYQCCFVNSPANMIIRAGEDIIKSDIVLTFFSKFFMNYDEFHKFAIHFDSKIYTKSIFDFDFSNPADKDYKTNLLHCFLGLKSKKQKNERNAPPPGQRANALHHLPNHFNGISDLSRNAVYFQGNEIWDAENHGSSITLFGGLLNHSCINNINSVFVDNKAVFIVRKPIKANEQLFVIYEKDCFLTNPSVADRRQRLRQFDFVCQCDACLDESYREKVLKPLQGLQSIVDRPSPKTYEEALKELTENFKYIQDHADNILTSLNFIRMTRNLYLMNFMSKLETFP